ncbi:Putative E3 ubiquitin-protein ligase XBOS32 [Picochlorum sp. SENEW3]|nr:Putative E3 ubiquitin-protein ligase XBOS32 [Picochlorum sp. SENEW3]
MSLRASLSVFLGLNFTSAGKLLKGADRGNTRDVKEILARKPRLAAFTGFHGTLSPLHRAIMHGDSDTCRAIIESCREYSAQQMEDGVAEKGTLLHYIVNQRTNRGTTPLMVACDKGYDDIVEMLFDAGADPLALDLINSRTCLHYAAIAGRAACVDLLTRDDMLVDAKGGHKVVLRDYIVQDLQVSQAKYIDQRAFGGLTALHFATVSGNVETVQVLLRRGAATMVKTDGDAFIGEEYLNPGSSPLHIAVLVNNMSIAHALLQAHAELMSAAGPMTEAGRRAWEGHSRTDIRSIRNCHRRLSYHLARERGRRNLMRLVDPRVSIDTALDTVRDAQQGLGAKRLSSICAHVIQQSMLAWLDEFEQEVSKKKSTTEDSVPRVATHWRHATADTLMFAGTSPSSADSADVDIQEDTPGRGIIRVHSENCLSKIPSYRNLRKKLHTPMNDPSLSFDDPCMMKNDSVEDCCDGKDLESSENSTCEALDSIYQSRTDSRECGVCLDALVQVNFHQCGHELCITCARNLTAQDKKPPLCPFCRQQIVGFSPSH